ncbi:MAG: stage II sporulation protein M [Pseudomonadota bacterium]|nr:stage II sporulation protein M [Pseudomonadota bacterium]
MAELTLKSRRFREERQDDWLRLERLLGRVEKNGAKKLSDDDLLAIPVLYRAALSSLSIARATSLDSALLDYLESLSARAYFVVYGVRASLWDRVRDFFITGWPQGVRRLWRETLASFLILILGAVIAYVLVLNDPDWFYSFVPKDLAGGRDPTASAETLRKVLYSAEGRDFLSSFAAFLFTHNAQVALLSFALGLIFGAPTIFLQLTNGCVMGAMVAIYAQHGLALPLGGWLLIHGVTELFALTLASAAGLHLGWTLVFPGERSRLDAMAQAGKRAGSVMFGVGIMLFVAGALEGVARQLVTDDVARYAIALASGLLWLAYFYRPAFVRGISKTRGPHERE